MGGEGGYWLVGEAMPDLGASIRPKAEPTPHSPAAGTELMLRDAEASMYEVA